MPEPTNPQVYARIKAQVKRDATSRWPSAYLSGLVVQKYKAAMKKRGETPYKSSSGSRKKSSLKRWYDEKWIDIKTGKPCGAVKTDKYYPTCRPSKRITSGSPRTSKEITEKEKKKMIRQKQKAKEKTVHYKYTSPRKRK